MAAVAENLTNLIEPVVAGLGYELLGIEYISQGRHSVLRLYIDSEQGIGLGDCEQVSRQVSGVMDVEDPLKGQYVLEVSSPGLDRPLFKAEHYVRYIGETVRIRLRRPVDNQRKFVVCWLRRMKKVFYCEMQKMGRKPGWYMMILKRPTWHLNCSGYEERLSKGIFPIVE